MECPGCGQEVKLIFAHHHYDIRYDEEQGKWVKEVGEVIYYCGGCTQPLSSHDIEDILRQVDEL